MSQEQLKSDCVKAFKKGNKQDAERLLPLIEQPAELTTLRLVSLLHLAAHHGWMDIIIDLITKYKCDTNCKDYYGSTPLHYAVRNNHLEVVRYFINEQHCDPLNKDSFGNTPLHIACQYGDMNIVQVLISETHQNLSCENNDGDTPLHIACHNDRLHIVQYLLSTGKVDPMIKNKNGDTPLHIACHNEHIHIIQYLLSTGKADPLIKNNKGRIPSYAVEKCSMFKFNSHLPMLNLAAHHGWMDIIVDLITKYKCDTNCKDDYGRTPLHNAASNNHLEVVRYLINEQHCDPMKNDDFGNTTLHIACKNGDMNTVQVLISETHQNLSCENNDGNTPLHIACLHGHIQIVQYLLSTGKVDLLAKNKSDMTPVDYASRYDDCYDLLKLFRSFPQCKRDFPVHTYTKLILTGYSGAGKTTISQLIRLLANKASGFFSVLSSGRVTDVECLTAGIIPQHVESKVNNLDNMVIYDFAGQQEYYSSHAAVLERIMKNSAAIFLCIVDLSQHMDKISESIHYWISFIENACSSAQGSSHLIIVGSHADLVKSSQELKEKSSLVENIAKSRVKQKLTYGGFERMDCRLSKTKEARYFCSLLSTSQQAILSSQPSMSLYCHVLYAFLRTKLRRASCTLQELTTALISENDYSYRSSLLTESLTSLNDKGLILFLQN